EDARVTFSTAGPAKMHVAFETLVPARAGWPRAEAGGGIAIARADGAIEHLRDSAHGLEQSWSFPARPANEGDLVVRVRATTTARSEETATGVRFVDELAAKVVTYDDVAWV